MIMMMIRMMMMLMSMKIVIMEIMMMMIMMRMMMILMTIMEILMHSLCFMYVFWIIREKKMFYHFQIMKGYHYNAGDVPVQEHPAVLQGEHREALHLPGQALRHQV